MRRPKLAVRDDSEAEVLLTGEHVPDRLVLELAQPAAILCRSLVEQSRVAGFVDAVHLLQQLAWPLEAADVVGSDRAWTWPPLRRSGGVPAGHELAVGIVGHGQAGGVQPRAQRLHESVGDAHRRSSQRAAVVAGEPVLVLPHRPVRARRFRPM